MAGEPCDCPDFDFALADRTVFKLKNGQWARYILAPGQEHPEVARDRYTVIDRCPWCNRKLTREAC